MKFYTREWFLGDREFPDPVEVAATNYFQSIQMTLSASIQAFQGAVNLHDAHLLQITFSAEARRVTVGFNELFWDAEHNCGNRRRLIIHYGGVASFAMIPAPGSVSSITPYDDLLCDEMDLADSGLFEHRMVFQSGTELHIRFHDFSYSNEPNSISAGNA